MYNFAKGALVFDAVFGGDAAGNKEKWDSINDTMLGFCIFINYVVISYSCQTVGIRILVMLINLEPIKNWELNTDER